MCNNISSDNQIKEPQNKKRILSLNKGELIYTDYFIA
jgi:hypothetical protein